MFETDDEAWQFLCEHVKVSFADGGVCSISEVFGMECVGGQANSFATTTPIPTACTIHYAGSEVDEVFIKIYTLDTQHRWNDFNRYEIKGYIHAMDEPRPRVDVGKDCFVGVMIHKDLNKDMFWPLETGNPKSYQQAKNRNNKGGWKGRGHPEASRLAEEADYLISFTSADREVNNETLRKFSSQCVQGPHGNRCITVCTDRSLGLPNHIVIVN